MRTNRMAVHALIIVAIALLATGSSGRWSATTVDLVTDTTRRAEERAPTRPRLVYYGRLGVPFLPREGRIALSGATITDRGERSPGKVRPACPAKTTAPSADKKARTTLARRGGA